MILLTVLLCAAIGSATQAQAQDVAQHTPVDAELSDTQVLQLVDRSTPGLEQFAAAMAAGDTSRARDLLVEHFTTRQRPFVPPVSFPGVREGNSMVTVKGSAQHKQAADETWLKHIFTSHNNDKGVAETHQLADPIDWYSNPSECFTWMLYINQLNLVAQLAGVWHATGEDKYAVEAGKLVQSWVAQCWRGYCYIRDGEMVNSGMEVRNRLCNCIAGYDLLRTCRDALTPEMHMAFWKLFIAHARELVQWAPGGTHDPPLVAYPGLLAVAVLFPEFTESGHWLEAGMRSLHNSIVERVTPEGAWHTHSISYQTVPYPWSLRSLEILQANSGKQDLSEVERLIRQQVAQMMECQFWTALPNGGLPNIGDSYGRADWGFAFNSTLPTYIWLKFPAAEQARLNAIADPCERLPAALATGIGAPGRTPSRTSVGLYGSGYYAMRSAWVDRQARYLYFDLSPQAYGHVHFDAGHLDMYAYGKPLLADTGDYFLGWGARTALHNTIEVDQSMQEWAAEMMPCEWVSTDGFDYVDGAHAGYEQRNVRHRRKILFVKRSPRGFADYWVLVDLLTGTGEHTYEQFFHFAGPSQAAAAVVDIDAATLVAATRHEDGANVAIVPVYTDGLAGGFAEAQDTDMDPKHKREREAMLGWMVTKATFSRVKSPVAVYTRRGEPPLSYYDVLFPIPTRAAAQVKTTPLTVTRDGYALSPEQAAGIRIDCSLRRPLHDPSSIRPQLGPNLATGAPAILEASKGRFREDAGALLTDGDPAPTKVARGPNTEPHLPNTALTGRFGVELPRPMEFNCMVIHDGIWNGSQLLYPAQTIRPQYWADGQWQDIADPRITRGEAETVSITFEAVKARRVSVAVERPAGGRLGMREFEVYRIADDELARVASLHEQTTTDTWTDYFLISHTGATPTRYGDFTFDGEMALIRVSPTGLIAQVSWTHGAELRRGEAAIVQTNSTRQALTVRWLEDRIVWDGVALNGCCIVTQEARTIVCGDTRSGCEPGTVWQGAPDNLPALRNRNVAVELQPPQQGLAGGQPWAVVTWRTDRPATSQVQYCADDGLLRRTPLDREHRIDHAARVEFLRKDRAYTFTAVSVDAAGTRATAEARP